MVVFTKNLSKGWISQGSSILILEASPYLHIYYSCLRISLCTLSVCFLNSSSEQRSGFVPSIRVISHQRSFWLVMILSRDLLSLMSLLLSWACVLVLFLQVVISVGYLGQKLQTFWRSFLNSFMNTLRFPPIITHLYSLFFSIFSSNSTRYFICQTLTYPLDEKCKDTNKKFLLIVPKAIGIKNLSFLSTFIQVTLKYFQTSTTSYYQPGKLQFLITMSWPSFSPIHRQLRQALFLRNQTSCWVVYCRKQTSGFVFLKPYSNLLSLLVQLRKLNSKRGEMMLRYFWGFSFYTILLKLNQVYLQTQRSSAWNMKKSYLNRFYLHSVSQFYFKESRKVFKAQLFFSFSKAASQFSLNLSSVTNLPFPASFSSIPAFLLNMGEYLFLNFSSSLPIFLAFSSYSLAFSSFSLAFSLILKAGRSLSISYWKYYPILPS